MPAATFYIPKVAVVSFEVISGGSDVLVQPFSLIAKTVFVLHRRNKAQLALVFSNILGLTFHAFLSFDTEGTIHSTTSG